MSVERFNAYSHIPLSDAPDSVNYALDAISNNLQRQEISPAFPTYNREPERVYDGLTLVADGVNWNPGEGRGLYIYLDGDWVFLGAQPDITIISVNATDDAGDGTVHGDVNATDFTSQVGTTFLPVTASDYLLVQHKQVAYTYVGPRPANLGLGGNYTSLADDYAPTGTNDHTLLINRDAADQHPIASITGLVADQQRQDDNLTAHEAAANPHPTYRDHSLQTNRNIADAHPMSSITGLLADQQRQDDALSDYAAGADAKYVAAGYGSIRQETSTGITIGAGWTTIPFSTAVVATPKNVEQDTANNSLHPLAEGIIILKAGIVLDHNESNQGRVLNFRIHDVDDNVSTGLVPYAVARNQPGSNVSLQVMGTINADRVGDNYVVQVQAGSGSFSGVTVEYANFLMYYVSEDVFGGGVSGGSGGIQSGVSYPPTIAPATGYQVKNIYVDDTGGTPRLAFEYDDTTQGVNNAPYLIESTPPPGQYFQVENLYVDDLGRLAFTFDDGT